MIEIMMTRNERFDRMLLIWTNAKMVIQYCLSRSRARRKQLTNTRSRIVELDRGEKLEALRHCRLFRGLKSEDIRELVLLATPVQYPKGVYIFHDGDPGEFSISRAEG